MWNKLQSLEALTIVKETSQGEQQSTQVSSHSYNFQLFSLVLGQDIVTRTAEIDDIQRKEVIFTNKDQYLNIIIWNCSSTKLHLYKIQGRKGIEHLTL